MTRWVSFVDRKPVNYIDPSGHHPCDEGSQYYKSYRCAQWKAKNSSDDYFGKYLQCSATDTRCRFYAAALLGINGWEYDILAKLYNEGGAYAIHGVNYILANGIHIKVGERMSYDCDPLGCGLHGDWQTLGDIEEWYDSAGKIIYLNPDQGYKDTEMPSAWGLATIIHEAKHIEQGGPLTKLKELEGWQIGFRVAEALGHYGADGINKNSVTYKILQLPLSADLITITTFTNYVKEYDQPDLGYYEFFKYLPKW